MLCYVVQEDSNKVCCEVRMWQYPKCECRRRCSGSDMDRTTMLCYNFIKIHSWGERYEVHVVKERKANKGLM